MNSQRIKTIVAQVLTGVNGVADSFFQHVSQTSKVAIDQESQLLVDAWNQVTTPDSSS